jgi:hypothetical protein
VYNFYLIGLLIFLESKIIVHNTHIKLYILFWVEKKQNKINCGRKWIRKVFRPKWSFVESVPGGRRESRTRTRASPATSPSTTRPDADRPEDRLGPMLRIMITIFGEQIGDFLNIYIYIGICTCMMSFIFSQILNNSS